MKLYRYILEPLSPWASRLRSDTLSGLILWHVAESEGAKRCQELIESFSAGKPPFVLSSPVRAEFVPMPALPPIGRTAFRKLAAELCPNEKDEELALFQALQLFKSFRKKALLPLEAWRENKDSLSATSLLLWHAKRLKDEGNSTEDQFSLSDFEPHVAIDRTTGSALEGQLFFVRLNYFGPEAKFHLYAETDDPGWLIKYLEQIGKVGFGREASTGKGLFKVYADKDFDAQSLECADSNAYLLLSLCASEDMSPVSGYYRLDEKLGKTGPGYKNPFKKPFLAIQEGSVLKKLPKPPYVLHKLNPDEQIVQILQALSFPCHLADKEAV